MSLQFASLEVPSLKFWSSPSCKKCWYQHYILRSNIGISFLFFPKGKIILLTYQSTSFCFLIWGTTIKHGSQENTMTIQLQLQEFETSLIVHTILATSTQLYSLFKLSLSLLLTKRRTSSPIVSNNRRITYVRNPLL